jgi:TPP-dependent 2-oxoacid decarboxylase
MSSQFFLLIRRLFTLPIGSTRNCSAHLEALQSPDKMHLVEVMMDQFDAPRALKETAELSSKTNKYAV